MGFECHTCQTGIVVMSAQGPHYMSDPKYTISTIMLEPIYLLTYFIHSSFIAERAPAIVASDRTSLERRVTRRMRNAGAVERYTVYRV